MKFLGLCLPVMGGRGETGDCFSPVLDRQAFCPQLWTQAAGSSPAVGRLATGKQAVSETGVLGVAGKVGLAVKQLGW